MPVINFITDEKAVNSLAKNRAWLDTYIPEVVRRLESMGYSVVFDQKSGFDLMHIHMPLSMAHSQVRRCAADPGLPIIYHGHATEDTFTIGNSTKYIVSRWLKTIASQSDLVICPSISSAQYYRSLLKDHPVIQLNYGINLDKYSHSKEARRRFREQYGISEDDIVVCCVGGISHRKGIDDFIALSRLHKDLKFMWIGDNYTNHPGILLFYKLFARQGDVKIRDIPPNLLMIGYTSHIPEALSASDIFFFPSRQETQGLALVEAAANGLPIVTRDLPVFREWLTPGFDCLMGTCRDDFSSGITSIANDSSLAARLGKQSLKSARKYHDINRTSATLARIYSELIADFKREYRMRTPATRMLKSIPLSIYDRLRLSQTSLQEP